MNPSPENVEFCQWKRSENIGRDDFFEVVCKVAITGNRFGRTMLGN
jgi:hypothetical protein